MLDIIKKTMLTGVGLALKTWDEVENLAKELTKKGQMTEQEGLKFLSEIKDKYSEAQEKLESRVDQSVNAFLKKADVVTKDELKGLKKEIRDLKNIITTLSDKE